MELVDSYLKAVKRYLPRRQRNDIIAELSEDLRSQLEARQRELGRPLTEDEQMAIFKRQGDPMAVALRYRQHGRSLTVGWELIGPELFPAYLLLLSFNLMITAAVVLIFQLLAHTPVSAQPFFVPLLAQVICVTLVFILLNSLKGVFRRKFSDNWMWPPADLAHLGGWIRGVRTVCPLVDGYPVLSQPGSGVGGSRLEVQPGLAQILPSHPVAHAGRRESAGRERGAPGLEMAVADGPLWGRWCRRFRDVVLPRVNGFLRWGLFGPWLWIP